MEGRTPEGRSWLSRRALLRGAAGMAALSRMPAAQASTVSGLRFAYIASPAENSIDVFRADPLIEGQRGWSRGQRVASPSPSCVVLSHSQTCLYVANEVQEHGGLPRGSVQAFRVEADGRLTLLACRPLSLSATRPQSMALSPDGKWLAVAAYGGGIYNLLPVVRDGGLGAPCSIFKEAGCGPLSALQASAHPHTLRFLGPELLLASDFGSDRISVFSTLGGKLKRRARVQTGEGSGPGECVASPDGTTIYALHQLAGELVTRRYHSDANVFSGPIQQFSIGQQGALAMHASGRMLYTVRQGEDALRAWRIAPEIGLSSAAGSVTLKGAHPEQIVAAPDGGRVFALGGTPGSIWAIETMPGTGDLGPAMRVAEAPGPRGLALKSV